MRLTVSESHEDRLCRLANRQGVYLRKDDGRLGYEFADGQVGGYCLLGVRPGIDLAIGTRGREIVGPRHADLEAIEVYLNGLTAATPGAVEAPVRRSYPILPLSLNLIVKEVGMGKTNIKSLDDAAAATGLGRRTLQRWLGAGLLTAYKVPADRKRYLDVREIERLRTTPQPIRGGHRE